MSKSAKCFYPYAVFYRLPGPKSYSYVGCECIPASSDAILEDLVKEVKHKVREGIFIRLAVRNLETGLNSDFSRLVPLRNPPNPPLNMTEGQIIEAFGEVDGNFLSHECRPLDEEAHTFSSLTPESVHVVVTVDDLSHLPSRSASLLRTVTEEERRTANVACKRRKAPSTDVKRDRQNAIQADNNRDAVDGFRPHTFPPTSLSIYHDAFAVLARELRSVDPSLLDPKDTETARDYVETAASSYNTEDIRKAGLRDFSQALRLKSGLRETQILFAVPSTKHPSPTSSNKIGDGGSPLVAQATRDYMAYWTASQNADVRNGCCCPGLLITIAGPYIAVHGAVFANKCIVQPLAQYTNIVPASTTASDVPRPSLSQKVLEVAWLFKCLRDAHQQLRDFYKKLALPNVPASRTSSVFPPPAEALPIGPAGPHWTEYASDSGAYQLRYTHILAHDNTERPAFLAERRPAGSDAAAAATRVVVKFTHQYGEAGHRLLAAAGLAPALHFCAYVESVGMRVVVMDYVDGSEFAVERHGRAAGSLREAVRLLHGGGYVFGDLREPNVLVPAADPRRAVLVDFDWCGRRGEARYPDDINMQEIEWAPGVAPGGLIEPEHDEYALEAVLGSQA